MLSQEVRIERDGRSIRILKALFRLKGFSERIRADHPAVHFLQSIVQAGTQLPAFRRLFDLHADLMLCVNESVLFRTVRLCAVEVHISFRPDREMAFMRRLKLCHVRGIRIHVKLRDPLLIRRVFVPHIGPDLPVFDLDLLAGIIAHDKIIGRPGLDEDVVAEPVVTVEEGHEAHDLRAVRNMVRRVSPCRPASDVGK